jgi:hypothetical protein
MSWKKILNVGSAIKDIVVDDEKKEESWEEYIESTSPDEDEDVTKALDKLEALYYELSQLDMDGVLDSRVPNKIEEALLLVHRKV